MLQNNTVHGIGKVTVDLSCLSLDKLEFSSKELSNVQVLDLSHNHLTSFPEVILTLKKIERVDLSWNHILEFPQNFPEHIVINKAWNRAKSSLDV